MNQRIYANSWLMSQTGDDTEFSIRLDQQYSGKQIRLQTFICDNLFMPFYRSRDRDFRVIGITVAGVTYQYIIDQNLESFDQVVEWFNDQGSPFKLVSIPQTKSYLNTVSVKVQNLASVDQISTLVGDAWMKLGFEMPSQTTTTHHSIRSYDFSQPPAILVLFKNLPRPFDTFQFLIPNNSSYGSKLFYNAQQQDNAQIIQFNQPISLNTLQVQLLNCDLMPLETPRQRNSKTNDNEMEVLMILDIV